MTFTTDQPASTRRESPSWDRYAQAIARARPECGGAFPDFLVIAPPRSGTTWLYENLRQHPELYLPEVKEIRYFDTEWRRHDINWYLEHFAPAGNRVKGEVSPPYVLLPDDAIRLIKGFNPRLKLVMLFRHPVKRAWSHISHAFKSFESPYEKRTGVFADAGIEAYLKGLCADYTVLTSNYAAILRRWLAHFPPEQFFVSSLEDAVREPADYFSRLYHFLGVEERNSTIIRTRVNAEVDWSANSPPRLFTDCANALFVESARDTRTILEETFGVRVNWEMGEVQESVSVQNGDRIRLENAMAALWHTKVAEWLDIGQGTDFNVFLCHSMYCAVRKCWGKPDFNLPMAELNALYPEGDFLFSESRDAILAILHPPKKARPIAAAYYKIRSLVKRIA